MFATLIHDLRHALRTLSRQPLFGTLAVVGLGIGIGLNMAVYSLFEQAVMRPLPVPAPGELVNLTAPGVKEGPTSTSRAGWRDAVFSYPTFRDLQQATTSTEAFTGLAAHRSFPTNIAFGERTVAGTGMLVSGNYFDVLRLRPESGRLLQPQDDGAAGAGRVAVLSYDFWRNAFGGDPRVVGRDLRVNGQTLHIVGIAPRGFHGTTFGITPQVFVPISLRWLLQPAAPKDENDRRSWWIYLFGRLAPGVSVGQARDVLNGTYAGLLRDVELPLQQGLDDNRRTEFLAGRIALDPGRHGQSELSGDLRSPLLMLLASAALVLLVACLNLANLLVARGIGRQAELALRASLGASRLRISRQLATEALVLAIGGLLLAVPIAMATLRALVAVLPNGADFAPGLALTPATFAFAAMATLVALFLFGVLPSLHAASHPPTRALRADSAQSTGSRGAMRLRGGLVVLQTSLSMAALALAGLFAQSLHHLGDEPLGVDAARIAGLSIFPGRSGYTAEQASRLIDRLDERLATLPGVEHAAFSQVQLFSNDVWQSSVRIEGMPPRSDPEPPSFNRVGEDYFATLGIPLLAGRAFTRQDSVGSPRVAIVSRRFAQYFGLDGNPIGRRFSFGGSDPSPIEIVGVAEDSKVSGVRAAEPLQIYLPRRQDAQITDGHWYLRTRGDPAAVLGSMRAAVAALDPQLPVENLQTLSDTITRNLAVERFVGALATAFAAIATTLAALGLFGVVTYALTRRRRELGVRLALGAQPARLARMLFAQAGRLGAIGMVIGAALAVAAGHLAQSLLFGVQGGDPAALALAAATLALVGIAAAGIPVLRIRRIDAAAVLREE